MAPLADNLTLRLKVKYTGPFNAHDMLFRAPAVVTVAGLVSAAQLLIAKFIETQWTGTTWTDPQVSAVGSNLFFPVAGWTPITAGGAINPSASSSPGKFLEFGGRSSGGRRVKYYLFETFFGDIQDMRYNRGDATETDDILDALQSGSNFCTALDGLATTYYDYANVKDNDFLTHKARH